MHKRTTCGTSGSIGFQQRLLDKSSTKKTVHTRGNRFLFRQVTRCDIRRKNRIPAHFTFTDVANAVDSDRPNKLGQISLDSFKTNDLATRSSPAESNCSTLDSKASQRSKSGKDYPEHLCLQKLFKLPRTSISLRITSFA